MYYSLKVYTLWGRFQP